MRERPSQGIDGITAAMVKGATAESLFTDAVKSALGWAKEFTVGSVMMAAENAKAEASLKALATARRTPLFIPAVPLSEL